MPIAKYDWPKLKNEFITSDAETVKAFLESKGMKAINFLKATTGWVGERKKYRLEVETQAAQKMLQTDIEDTTKVRERQARLARFMQLKGAGVMKDLSVDTVEDARKLIQTGMQEERKALGMEGNSNHQSLTQININAGPKTNIDRLVENASYEELLEIIAGLRREKSKRTGTETVVESTGEVEEGEVL